MVKQQKITTTRPTTNFLHLWLVPFTIQKRISANAYKLDLPKSMEKVHPVFHVGLLRRYEGSKIANQEQSPPEPVIIQDDKKFEIAEVLDKRQQRGKVEYLISWEGYDANHDSWEPESSMNNAQELIDEFNFKYPQAETQYRRVQRKS